MAKIKGSPLIEIGKSVTFNNIAYHLFRTILVLLFFKSSPEDVPVDFREKGTERDTLMGERNIHLLPLVGVSPGTKPATQACVLTRDQTCDFLVYGMALQPIDYTVQSFLYYF